MSWNQFFIYLSGIYCLYYVGNIVIDLLKPKARTANSNDPETIFFADDLVPQLVVVEDERSPEDKPEHQTPKTGSLPAPAIESTGGMRIMDFIASAKPDVYEFTRAIPYG